MIPDRATVKMACGKAATVDGIATIMIAVPVGKRKINGGLAWFENRHPDDKLQVFIALANGTPISGYTDTDVPSENQGWFIPNHADYVEIERLVEFGTLPEGLYLKVVGIKGDLSSDTFRVNLHWGTIG